ncbi:MAG: DUF2243 domain-containing protein [Thermoleophilia bacterium]|nr:DUF2243 domain-containing protein [Beijerinckiaceae bacterium]MBY0396678.1 DUF2243 domain-containing protein [Thermoleophilia bacterium]
MAVQAARGETSAARAGSGLGAPGVLPGAGLVDGIVLHQLLRWHHLVSRGERWPTTTVRGLEINVLADGLFHLGVLAGSIVMGWGLLSLGEGMVNHHVPGIHDVRDDVETARPWNVGLLATGAVLVLAGRRLTRVRKARLRGGGRPGGCPGRPAPGRLC